MSAQYKVIAPRSELAMYYGWEYGVKIANKMLKALKGKGFHGVKPLSDSYMTRDRAESLATRVRQVVTEHKVTANHKRGNSVNVYVEKA